MLLLNRAKKETPFAHQNFLSNRKNKELDFKRFINISVFLYHRVLWFWMSFFVNDIIFMIQFIKYIFDIFTNFSCKSKAPKDIV